VIKINGMEIEGTVKVTKTADGGFIIKEVTEDAQDAPQNEPVVEESIVEEPVEEPIEEVIVEEETEEDESQRVTQVCFKCDPSIVDTLDKMFKTYKATTTGKQFKADYLEMIMVKGIVAVKQALPKGYKNSKS